MFPGSEKETRLVTGQQHLNKKRRNATKPGFQRFNQVLI